MKTQLRMAAILLAFCLSQAAGAEDWTQLKYDARRSGNVPDRQVAAPLGLVAAAPLTDAVFTSPVVASGRVYVVDGSGTAFCFEAPGLKPVWKFATRGGPANCSNVSSPAIAAGYLHFGTMAGDYYVLDAASGKPVRQIACGEPIFSAPVVMGDRVYFITLGSRLHALKPDGTLCWTWDFLKERLKLDIDRWSAQDWLKQKSGRVTWRDQFCCARDMAASGSTLIVPAGGEILWIADGGDQAKVHAVGEIPRCAGSERAANFGTSVGEDGTVYQQWHRRDNTGRVEMLWLLDGKIKADHVLGTMTASDMPDSLGFSSVSLRGQDVYRCRPEDGFGLCLHRRGEKEPQVLSTVAAVDSPILAGDKAIYGALDGRLYVVPLAGKGQPWSFATAFGKPITAAACVCDGRVYFGGEDGYLYVLGPGGAAPLPKDDLQLTRIRSSLTGKLADAKYDWFTAFADFGNTNANDQGIKPPLAVQWIRRYEGSFKHLPVCGGGRMYTHTAEGQIFAVEQQTGRLLWRRHWPGVHVSYTAPLYYRERLLVPQAGLGKSMLRCLDAATGALVWEAPFSGSPSWSRQQPPVVWKNLAFYMFSTGKYVPKGTGLYVMRMSQAKELPRDTAGSISWLYSHDNPFYPGDQRAIVEAYDLDTGKVVWTRDFSEHGTGGDDAGLCVLDDALYYSAFFGYAARDRQGQPSARGLTAALDPLTGKTKWLTTKYSVTAGCAISGADGRLYVGGYNQPDVQTQNRYVWCLDARDGSLIWQSEPVKKAINVVTVGPKSLFVFAYGGLSYLLDKQTGKILSQFTHRYACTRFSLSWPYLLGANTDLVDLSDEAKVVSTGPPLDLRECVGAVASNGRLFYTAQASGLQMCQVWGEEAATVRPVWRQ